MPETKGINHLGLAVWDLTESKAFFTELLGWKESGYDASYPRTAVSDGVVRLTLWQVDKSKDVSSFDRRRNIGLHHLALEVESEIKLNDIYKRVSEYPGATIEFPPELVGAGPRKHMMCNEPGGIRVEFIWQGT
jgi:catechol 2,3-dioxygenase-like lactoylglutathione lyase family enzyme